MPKSIDTSESSSPKSPPCEPRPADERAATSSVGTIGLPRVFGILRRAFHELATRLCEDEEISFLQTSRWIGQVRGEEKRGGAEKQRG